MEIKFRKKSAGKRLVEFLLPGKPPTLDMNLRKAGQAIPGSMDKNIEIVTITYRDMGIQIRKAAAVQKGYVEGGNLEITEFNNNQFQITHFAENKSMFLLRVDPSAPAGDGINKIIEKEKIVNGRNPKEGTFPPGHTDRRIEKGEDARGSGNSRGHRLLPESGRKSGLHENDRSEFASGTAGMGIESDCHNPQGEEDGPEAVGFTLVPNQNTPQDESGGREIPAVQILEFMNYLNDKLFDYAYDLPNSDNMRFILDSSVRIRRLIKNEKEKL